MASLFFWFEYVCALCAITVVISDILGFIIARKSAVLNRYEMGGIHKLFTSFILLLGIYGIYVIFTWLGL